jgi:hypothetical protein
MSVVNRLQTGLVVGFVALVVGAGKEAEEKPVLRMTKPVVCRKVHGFANFEPIDDPKFTVDDKVTIYYEPGGYTIEPTKTGFRALLIQDGRLRKKGSKDAVWKKDKMFEYEAVSKNRPYQVYLKTDLGLKGLAPGDYELDMTLRDGLAKDVSLMKTVGFTVVPLPEADEVKEKSPTVPPVPPEGKPGDR